MNIYSKQQTLKEASCVGEKPFNRRIRFSKIFKNKEKVRDLSPLTHINEDSPLKRRKSRLMNLMDCGSSLGFIAKCFAKPKLSRSQERTGSSLLGPQPKHLKGRKTLVLDLDETLVHSTLNYTRSPDLVLPVRIKGVTYTMNILKRPGLEKFLKRASELFEVVIFTASIPEYAYPLIKKIDKENKIASVLFREACTLIKDAYVKDLSKLGRNLKNVILVDNLENSFFFQPENAYHIKDFIDDKSDVELENLLPFLEHLAKDSNDVRPVPERYQRFKNPHKGNTKIKKNENFLLQPQQNQLTPSIRRRSNRRNTENAPIRSDLNQDTDSPRMAEELEALKLIRSLSKKKTLMKHQIKCLDMNQLETSPCQTNGSASTAYTKGEDGRYTHDTEAKTPAFNFYERHQQIGQEVEEQENKENIFDLQLNNNEKLLSKIIELVDSNTVTLTKVDMESEEIEGRLTLETDRETLLKLVATNEELKTETKS